MASETERGLVAVVDRIKAECRDHEAVEIGHAVDAVGRRGLGTLLLLVALVSLSPLGSIPGSSIVFGAILLLLSAQVTFGVERVWLPGFVRRRSLPGPRLTGTLDRFVAVGRWLGPLLRRRLEAFLEPPVVRLVGFAGAVFALSMMVFGFFPFGSFPAAIGFIAIGLGMTVRDGLLVLGGLLFGAALTAAALQLLPF
jgi:hypothetical protein